MHISHRPLAFAKLLGDSGVRLKATQRSDPDPTKVSHIYVISQKRSFATRGVTRVIGKGVSGMGEAL